MRELILSNNKRLYHGAQSAADRTAATADMAETSVKQRAAGMEGGSDEDSEKELFSFQRQKRRRTPSPHTDTSPIFPTLGCARLPAS